MTRIIEVTAVGYNGETDATDDRVLWVFAPSVVNVKAVLTRYRAPHLEIVATDLDTDMVSRREVLDLEHDVSDLVATLYGFAMTDIAAALDSAESFIAGFEDDDMQEGINEKLAQVRHAQVVAKSAAAPQAVPVMFNDSSTKTNMCIEVIVPNEYGVKVEQFANKRFRVSYGLDVKGKSSREGLGYGAACKAFGQGVFHALACAGRLDNNGPD